MAAPNLTIVKGQGGLGRPLTGEDHISGLVFFNATLPAGFGSANEKTFTSLAQAEAAGITSTAAAYKRYHYHIKEFFRMNPLGILHVGIYPIPGGTYDFAPVTTLQYYAGGKIRQMGVYAPGLTTITATPVAALQAKAAALETEGKPLLAILAVDISGTADITTLADLRSAGASPLVQVCIGQDGGSVGAALAVSEGDSITCLGAMLGLYSAIPVSNNIGWVKSYNMAGAELAVPAFANGQLYSALSASAVSALYDKGYVFLRTHQGVGGTYFAGSPTCVVSTNDYSSGEAVRTIQKAIRQVRAFISEAINGPVLIDPATGFISDEYAAYLTALGNRALAEMEAANEISGSQTIVNPEQNVVSTGSIAITIEIVPIGTANTISITIGFVTALS
jgi:hypothetical protein